MINICFLKNTEILLLVLLLFIFKAETQEVKIIPYPNDVRLENGVFNLSVSDHLYYDKECKAEALFLQKILSDDHNFKIAAAEKKSTHLPTGGLYLTSDYSDTDTMIHEEYRLKVDPKNIVITGRPAGIFYGIQSLRQIIKRDSGLIVPCLTINDRPRFAWRAFMLDEGRYFKGMKVVKDLLDEMALLKMNTFHWHLTDDGGWRIEIKKYPKLTEIGSKRRMSEMGTWLSNVFDSVPHSGYYTQEQIKEIIKYAADRHITIIPEIEMPGHASAAIASYPWLGSENKQIEVPISFGIKLDVFNVANSKVKQFLHDVLDEVMELFPSKIVHIGGDEVKYEQWKASAEVQAYMKANNIKTPVDLQIEFTNGISNYLQQHNQRMIGWNDILGGLHGNNDSLDASVKEKLSESTIIQFWTGDPEIVTQAAMKGYDVVNSYWNNTYLDYDYKATPLRKAYNFNPIPASLPQNLQHKILGIGTQMWGEWIPTVKKMNYLVYPRIAAMAEIGWIPNEKKDFNRFLHSLKNSYLIDHWKKKGIALLPEQLH
jgi:hexosaminidase